ncbi:MAG: hypothetical protein U0K83_03490 [Bacteroidales bacterium]|jgi:UDP-N-acetylmuramoylalanine--D-glutamate ligase|nr:hypothetical protein [Bacteroidales bacterium]MEE1097374.1 hypothetical protein [Bacteroidales bacterium]
MNIEDLAVQGRKSIYGNLAERNYSEMLRYRNNTLRSMFSDRQSMNHKNQVVANIKGVSYIDDARSIKPNSTWFTFEQTNNPIIWILDPSEGIKDLTCLIGEVKQKVHTLIIVGEDIANVKKTFVGLTNLIQAANLEEAVKTAYFFANEPDVVIYSPASGSEEQVDINGKRFLRLVNDL